MTGSSSSYYKQNKVRKVAVPILTAFSTPFLIGLKKKKACCVRLKLMALERKPKRRWSWNRENKRFSDCLFYQLFRMERACFDKLVGLIETAVGGKGFKSECYLEQLERGGRSTI